MRRAAAIVLAIAVQDAAPPRRVECDTWTTCRDRALEAAAQQDYERFHDLAWRAIQTGPKNDAALMFLLARAQSLSGRPHDALVMLARIAGSAEARGALTSDEFATMRELKGWPEVEARIKGTPLPATPPPVSEPVKTPPPASAAKGDTAAEEAFTFEAGSFQPVALAYDRVSRRFIIADSDISRLAVVDEFSRHLATLASGKSAGFGTVTAIEIDPREGDLWVASVDTQGAESKPRLHKLQLISGRVLKEYGTRAGSPFLDIALSGASVLAVDARRLFRLRPTWSSLEATATWTHTTISSVAVSSSAEIYVASDRGIERVNGTGVHAPASIDLTRLARIRWARGSLFALQGSAGAYRLIRIRLSRDGQSATAVDVLDADVRAPHPALTIAGDTVFYFAQAEDGKIAIRKRRT
jgi:hypothetical protein